MSIRSFDRAQDAYNLAKKEPVQQKVVMIVVPVVRAGVAEVEIGFPYNGRVVSFYASCITTGAEKTNIQLEKCSQADFDNTPEWVNVFTVDATIDAGKKSTRSSLVPYELADDVVNRNDHFRLNITEAGTGISGITAEVIIQI